MNNQIIPISLVERMVKLASLYNLPPTFVHEFLEDSKEKLQHLDALGIYRQFKNWRLKGYKRGHGQYERAEYYGQLYLSVESAIAVEMMIGHSLTDARLGRREKVKALEKLILQSLDTIHRLELELAHAQSEIQLHESTKEFFK